MGRGIGRTLTLAALTAAAACAPGVAPSEAHASTGSPVISFTANGMPGERFAERRDNYLRLRRAGVRAIRLDMTWTEIEPVGEPLGDYDFSRLDREVRAIRAAGLEVIGLLAYGHPDYSAAGGASEGSPGGGSGLPPFNVGAAHYFPPDDPEDFARYARAVASHYDRGVIGWEVWNEQNQGWRFWAPREDPAAYAELLCATHRAIRKVDRKTPIVYGGTFYPAVPPALPGMSGPDFVRASYAANPRLGRCFDVLAYHPYPYPFTAPELDVPIRGSVLAAERGMRRAMPPRDRHKPLWITEIGWPTHERAYGVSRRKQAQYLTRTLAASFAAGIPLVSWYTYGDEGDPSGANQEAHFGVFDSANEPKPSYRALKRFSRILGGASFRRDLARRLGMPAGTQNVSGGGFALRFREGRRRVTILWYANESAGEGQGATPEGGTAGEEVDVRLPVAKRRVKVLGHLAGSRMVRARKGRVELVANADPIYVVERPLRRRR